MVIVLIKHSCVNGVIQDPFGQSNFKILQLTVSDFKTLSVAINSYTNVYKHKNLFADNFLQIL